MPDNWSSRRDASSGSRREPSALRRLGLLVVVAALLTAACSSTNGASSQSSDPSDPSNPSDTAFDPNGTEAAPNEDLDLDLDIGDDVIIGTEDGEIPPTTTDPPVEDTPDAPPPDATTTTVAPADLPDPVGIGRIVSMSPTHTETLFALGLGDFVVAVDSDSDFPDEAAAVRRDDLFADSADIGAVLALDPDIVLVGEDLTGFIGRLNAAGVASYSGPPATSLGDVFAQIREIAGLVDRPDLADDLIARMQNDIDSIIGSIVSNSSEPLTFFHEIDPSLFTVGTDTFLDSVYGELGLVNIAPTNDTVAQMSSDAIIAANPDVILLGDAECCGVTIDIVAARPGWAALSAVESGAIVPIDEDLIHRWGPRVVELIRAVAGGVAAATR